MMKLKANKFHQLLILMQYTINYQKSLVNKEQKEFHHKFAL